MRAVLFEDEISEEQGAISAMRDLHLKIRREGPEAKIVLPIVESNNKITTTSKSKSDFKVARVTTEEQENFSNQL